MAYGMELFRSSWCFWTYSSTDATWNQVASFHGQRWGFAAALLTLLSAVVPALVTQMFINAPPTDRKALAHTISVSGTTVTVSGGNETVFILVLMR